MSLLPKAINARYVCIGGPMAQAVLDRLVNRPKSGISLCVLSAEGIKIPRRLNIKQLVMSHCKDVRFPKNFSAPSVLLNCSVKGNRPEIAYNTRMSHWANLKTQWLYWVTSQTLNQHDIWFPGPHRYDVSTTNEIMPTPWKKQGAK